MYEVVVMNYADNKRITDSILTTRYQRKGNAERKARERTRVLNDNFYTRAYVRKELTPVSEEVAKAAYCNSKHVYIDTKYGKDQLKPSYEYCSHAPARELFYRSITDETNWWESYKGNFYIEIEESN